MSAYGTIAAPLRSKDSAPVLPRVYALPSDSHNLAVVPLRRESVPDELAAHLHQLFNGIVEEGRTYPQEATLDLQAFKVASLDRYV